MATQENLPLNCAAEGATLFDLRLQDCVEGLQNLEADFFDIVMTSPPYNLEINYRTYRDARGEEDYLNWCCQWAGGIKRVLKPDGSLFLNIGASPSNPLLPHRVAITLSSLFTLQNTLHWIKAISLDLENGTVLSKGHFKPIKSRSFVNDCHEYVFHLTKHGNVPIDRKAVGVPYQDKSNIARWNHTDGHDLRCRGNTWFVPYKTIQNRNLERPHPATFPVELALRCCQLHGLTPQSAVLDPFLGIGNSALAARKGGAGHFTGFEIDDYYLKVARERLGLT